MKDLWVLLYGNMVTKYSSIHLLSVIYACNMCGCLLRLHMVIETEKCSLEGSWESVLSHFPLKAGLLPVLAQYPHGFVWGLETCKDGEPRASLAPVPVLPSPRCCSLLPECPPSTSMWVVCYWAPFAVSQMTLFERCHQSVEVFRGSSMSLLKMCILGLHNCIWLLTPGFSPTFNYRFFFCFVSKIDLTIYIYERVLAFLSKDDESGLWRREENSLLCLPKQSQTKQTYYL